jgi:hypothetical protein
MEFAVFLFVMVLWRPLLWAISLAMFHTFAYMQEQAIRLCWLPVVPDLWAWGWAIPMWLAALLYRIVCIGTTAEARKQDAVLQWARLA